MDKMVRKLWPSEARPIQVKLEDIGGLIAIPKVFKTGSVGWYANGKVTISDTPVQVNICITVIGSKSDDSADEVNTEQDIITPIFLPDSTQRPSELANGSAPVTKGRKRS
jgi:hypothetical protein